ncbi:MAG TPA: hypothetical protein VFW00_05600 [Rhodocyclaceae bacterium]|nr:hypothetical protein [Rhodocyclaceae bacterium]
MEGPKPVTKIMPVAMIIAAQMRIGAPKASRNQTRVPVNVKSAIKKAANSSPMAKAAFKQAAPAVKATTPHLQALARQQQTQPGKGLMSSLGHGVSAMRSLRQVTKAMSKETAKNNSAKKMTTSKSAFAEAAASSPAAKAAFGRSGPATERARKHVDALSSLQQQPKGSLMSSLGHGIQAMRALRNVTREMKKEKSSPLLSAHSALAEAKASSPAVAQAFKNAGPATARASTHLGALAHLQQQPKGSLMSSLRQGLQAASALRRVTKELGKAATEPNKTSIHDWPSIAITSNHSTQSAPVLAVMQLQVPAQFMQQILKARQSGMQWKKATSATDKPIKLKRSMTHG